MYSGEVLLAQTAITTLPVLFTFTFSGVGVYIMDRYQSLVL